MTKLSVNVNKVAYLRNTRDVGVPDVVEAARVAIAAGAHGITVHPRPDQRHIRPADVYALREMLTVEYNIEGNPYPEYLQLARDTKPDQCTLVPDAPEASTSDQGWDLRAEGERLKPIIAELKTLGCRVSLFMNPVPEDMALAKRIGADRVELYTAPYAAAFANGAHDMALSRYRAAAKAAQEEGLGVNAGHDLNLDNLPHFLTIQGVLEVSIGHALIADALFMGLSEAVKAYLRTVSPPLEED